MLCNKG